MHVAYVTRQTTASQPDPFQIKIHCMINFNIRTHQSPSCSDCVCEQSKQAIDFSLGLWAKL